MTTKKVTKKPGEAPEVKKSGEATVLVDEKGEPVVSADDPEIVLPPEEELLVTPPYEEPPPAEGP